MTQWSGWPENSKEAGYHVISSALGRNMTVYAWSPHTGIWCNVNSLEMLKPEQMAGLTYIGRVVQHKEEN